MPSKKRRHEKFYVTYNFLRRGFFQCFDGLDFIQQWLARLSSKHRHIQIGIKVGKSGSKPR